METMRPSHDDSKNQNDAGFPGSPPSGSSSSSSTCSSPSPFSPLPSPTPHRGRDVAGFKKSMEEVWKDINLPSLVQDHAINTHTTKHTTTITGTGANPFSGMILQDFLARSFNPMPPAASAASFGGSGTPAAAPLPPPPPPATTLSLNSPGPEPVITVRPNNQSQPQLLLSDPSIGSLISFGSSISSAAFDPFGSASASAPSLPSSCKKRANHESVGEESGRHMRMIKNRESAARSRARKQAYTQELELEVAQLVEENAKLRRQQEKLLAAAVQLPKKHTLSRTLTAPF